MEFQRSRMNIRNKTELLIQKESDLGAFIIIFLVITDYEVKKVST